MTIVIIAVVLAGALWFGWKVGAAARCPHCGFTPHGFDAKISPVCQRCGKAKRA